MLRLNPTVLKLTMSEVKDLDTRRRFHNYLKVEDSAAHSTKAREKQPDVPSTNAEKPPPESSPGGAELPDGTPNRRTSAGSAPDTPSAPMSASQPLGCDGLDEGPVQPVKTDGVEDIRGPDGSEILGQQDSSPCPTTPGPSTPGPSRRRDQEAIRGQSSVPASLKRTTPLNRQRCVLGFGLTDLVYSADWGSSSSSSSPPRPFQVRSGAAPTVDVGREVGIGAGRREMVATSEERDAQPFLRRVPTTPSRLRVYNDSLPAATQPRTPHHLPEARHQSRLNGAFTVPIRRAHPASTPLGDTPAVARQRRQQDRERRAMSPPWLRRDRYGSLQGGIENADASIMYGRSSGDTD
ncbi:hypothetical protein QBC39DRAFT_339146 [Podospora conica]|nr:hypothetical protein QBC39DRAFT_339146 [Schizothecium conicum]